MAIVYVWDSAGGTPDGTSWTDAYTTLAAGIAAMSVTTDLIYLASDHSETLSSSTTYGTGGSNSSPVIVYSVDRTDDSYLPASSVQIDASGGVYNVRLDYCAWAGVYVKYGGDLDLYFHTSLEDCYLEASGTTSIIEIQSDFSPYQFRNCTIEFVDADSYVKSWSEEAFCEWHGCTFIGPGGAQGFHSGGMMRFFGCDFTGITTNKIINSVRYMITGEYHHCSFPSGFTYAWSNSDLHMHQVFFYNCDEDGESAGKLYRSASVSTSGKCVTDEDTYRTGGWRELASTPLSYSMIPADVGGFPIVPERPLVSIPFVGWLDSTGSKTFTIEVASNYASEPDASELWMELYYLGTANSTLWTMVSTRDKLGSTALTSSSESWSGASGFDVSKLTKTVTVARAGFYKVVVCLGTEEEGKQVNVCPLVGIV